MLCLAQEFSTKYCPGLAMNVWGVTIRAPDLHLLLRRPRRIQGDSQAFGWVSADLSPQDRGRQRNARPDCVRDDFDKPGCSTARLTGLPLRHLAASHHRDGGVPPVAGTATLVRIDP